MKLKDKVTLVTGAGAGIGKEIALAFAREGAKIGVNDEHADEIEVTLEEINKLGGEGIGLHADVAYSQQVKEMFNKLVNRFGTLDILVNNAGLKRVIARAMENSAKQDEQLMTDGVSKISLEATRYMTDEEWRQMLEVHLFGTFYCTREALGIMEDKGYGKIVNIASICGIMGCPIAPDYSAAKGGIIAFTKAVAAEVIGRGVYVNCVAPGYIDTAPPQSTPLPRTPPILHRVIMRTPLGRLGTTAEVASVVLFLASDESSYMVGQIISPNGGLVI